MSVEIEFLGHAGFLLTSSAGCVAIDPWLEGNPVATKKRAEVSCDWIVLTHGHADHMSDAQALAKANNATVLAAFEICEYLGAEGVKTDPGNTGGRISTPFGWVAFTQAFHSSSFQGRYMGMPCGVIVRFEAENFTFHHLGDTALFSDLKLIGELYKPDVAAIPVGDRFTMGPEQGKVAAELIKPRIAIPIHWGTFPILAQDISAFKPQGVEVKEMRPGEKWQVR